MSNPDFKFHVIRWPNSRGLKRGPNMMKNFCQCCKQEATHGYQFSELDWKREVTKCDIFVCDGCFDKARRAV